MNKRNSLVIFVLLVLCGFSVREASGQTPKTEPSKPDDCYRSWCVGWGVGIQESGVVAASKRF